MHRKHENTIPAALPTSEEQRHKNQIHQLTSDSHFVVEVSQSVMYKDHDNNATFTKSFGFIDTFDTYLLN